MDDGLETGLGLCVAHNSNILFQNRTKVQQARIIESNIFGKMIFCDNIPVMSEADCCHYNEMMVHVPMMTLPNVKRVLVIGGISYGILK